jgi:hypothetical protein
MSFQFLFIPVMLIANHTTYKDRALFWRTDLSQRNCSTKFCQERCWLMFLPNCVQPTWDWPLSQIPRLMNRIVHKKCLLLKILSRCARQSKFSYPAQFHGSVRSNHSRAEYLGFREERSRTKSHNLADCRDYRDCRDWTVGID